MRTLDLGDIANADAGSASFRVLRRYFVHRKDTIPHLYRTFWTHSTDEHDKDTFRNFFFFTGSRDVHLALGDLPKEIMDALCAVLCEEMLDSKDPSLTLTHRLGGKMTSILFTKATEEGRTVSFHLSPLSH